MGTNGTSRRTAYQAVLTLSSASHSDPTLKSGNATGWLWVHMPV